MSGMRALSYRSEETMGYNKERLNKFNKRYGKKNVVNGGYYSTITVTGMQANFLTEEEFRSGKAGLVWMDQTGKLVFRDPPSPGESEKPKK